MSHGEQSTSLSEICRLREEIASLSEQQVEAQKAAAILGMTIQDSQKYRKRHSRIQELRRRLLKLGGLLTG
jgi:hypothetical protein